jgi:predicted nucleic acid-binding protein
VTLKVDGTPAARIDAGPETANDANGAVPIVVVDSHALLAFLRGEAGAEQVAALLESARRGRVRAIMPTLTLGEVAYVTERRSGLRAAHAALAAIDQLPIEVLAVDRVVALSAAHLKAAQGLHYVDATVAALASVEGGAVLTGDQDFAAIEAEVPVEWLPA